MPKTIPNALCPKCNEPFLVKTTFGENMPVVEECTNCGYRNK